MQDSNNDLKNRLAEILSQKQASPDQAMKPELPARGAEMDMKRRETLIGKLQSIVEKASSGRASSGDISKAQELNELLNGEFSGLVSAIATAVEQAEAAKAMAASAPSASHAAPTTSASNYFNRAEAKQSAKTASDIESGKDVKDKDLTQMVEHLTSDKERALRDKTYKDLEEEKKNLAKAIIVNGGATEEQKAHLAEIDKQKVMLIKDAHRDKAITSVIGEHTNPRDRAQAALAHKPTIMQTMQKLEREGVQEIRNIERAMAKETHVILETAERSTPKTVAAAITAVSAEMVEIEKEIKQEAATRVEAIEKKVFSVAENVVGKSSEATKKEDKTADKAKSEVAISDKLAAMKAKKAAAAKAQESKVPAIEQASGGSLRPDPTPAPKAGPKLDGPGIPKKPEGNHR